MASKTKQAHRGAGWPALAAEAEPTPDHFIGVFFIFRKKSAGFKGSGSRGHGKAPRFFKKLQVKRCDCLKYAGPLPPLYPIPPLVKKFQGGRSDTGRGPSVYSVDHLNFQGGLPFPLQKIIIPLQSEQNNCKGPVQVALIRRIFFNYRYYRNYS